MAEAPPTERNLVVVSAGLSEPSATRLLADRLAASVERQLGEVHGLTTEILHQLLFMAKIAPGFSLFKDHIQGHPCELPE